MRCACLVKLHTQTRSSISRQQSRLLRLFQLVAQLRYYLHRFRALNRLGEDLLQRRRRLLRTLAGRLRSGAKLLHFLRYGLHSLARLGIGLGRREQNQEGRRPL